MTGHDMQKANDTKAAEADAALVTTFALGAHQPDSVEPDGGELAAAMVYFSTVADPKI